MRLPVGATLIDDSYNANPLSTCAALDTLLHHSGESVFVFGDMGELGDDAKKWHAHVGEHAKALGLDRMYCYGELAKETAAIFGEGAQHYNDKQDLIAQLKESLTQDQAILVKGSRSMKMDEVVTQLLSTE